ncbi:MAG TPA: SMC-Scp complex subunit ScpB [Candidatus Paceibacterota bacterium]|nr:SMC-Scp complex subunit ScpB [Candidatus Paceibacterota bacterium]
MDLAAKIEAVLFYRAEPVKKVDLAKLLGVGSEELEKAINNLKERLLGQGLILLELKEEIELGTAPEASSLIEQIAKEELARELGKAALETLTLIIYQGPISRPEIDQVRGVNSSFILRNLMVRGLVERTTDGKDSRRFLYQPTLELLRHLGIEKIEDLPEYEDIQQEINNFLEGNKDDNGTNTE